MNYSIKERIEEVKGKLTSEDILVFEFDAQSGKKFACIYADGIVDKNMIGELVIKPLREITSGAQWKGEYRKKGKCAVGFYADPDAFTLCLHFGEKGGCFYGGLMQQEVYPAVRRCDGIVMLCPNYNDALSANLTAFINRLTALFRQTRFYDKALFAVIVSGYSGGDILARQLIAGMNMNKSFYLPPRFALLETANDPGQAVKRPGVDQRLDAFARTIRSALKA